jgi:6-phosphofructo-2-kinase/fructose-2,6-biphosphatase 2
MLAEKVFNVGQLRRTRARQRAQQYVLFWLYETRLMCMSLSFRSGVKEEHTASWFSHDNQSANESREKLAQDSLEMLIAWLKEGGNVGIHGASFV